MSSPAREDAPDYSWTDFYPRLVDALLTYRDDRATLLEKTWTVSQVSGRPALFKYLRSDRYADGTTGPIRDIDPFSIVGTFNRGIRDDARAAIARAYGREFAVAAALSHEIPRHPGSEQHVVVVLPLGDRASCERDRLAVGPVRCSRGVCRAGRTRRPVSGLVAAFDGAATGDTRRLTMGVFWTRPQHFAAYDSRNATFLRKHFPEVACNALTPLSDRRRAVPREHREAQQLAGRSDIAIRVPFRALLRRVDGRTSRRARYPAASFGASARPGPYDDLHEMPIEPYSLDSIREDGSFRLLQRTRGDVGTVEIEEEHHPSRPSRHGKDLAGPPTRMGAVRRARQRHGSRSCSSTRR